MIDLNSVSDFRARWRAVAEREAEERRRIPPAVRWQQESRSVKTTKDTKAPKRSQRILLPLCVLREYFVPFVAGNYGF